MALYLEASKILKKVFDKTTSVKTSVFASQYQNKKQLFALVQETLKYNTILAQIVNNSKLLQREKSLQNDLVLAEVLVYDFLIGKGLKTAAKLKQAILRHKTEILAHCERLKVKAKVNTVRDLLPDAVKNKGDLPRYARINYLKSSSQQVREKLDSGGWKFVEGDHKDHQNFLKTISNLKEAEYTSDHDLRDLLVFPAGTDLHDDPLVQSGQLILQDKASCFPAHVLGAAAGSHIIDSCAAPGNKTSHVCSLIRNDGKIHAFDRDRKRLQMMERLLRTTGSTCVRAVCRDFLTVKPSHPDYRDVEYILVDPSCSGSGMANRMDHIVDSETAMSGDRLKSLARFQISILKHALRFPSVRRVVYSTCSVHATENEEVVEEVYEQVSDKFDLVSAMPAWPERGLPQYEHASKFCRLSVESALTNGFFVACFQRKEQYNYQNDQRTEPDEAHNCVNSGFQKKKRKLKDEPRLPGIGHIPAGEKITEVKSKKQKQSRGGYGNTNHSENPNIDKSVKIKVIQETVFSEKKSCEFSGPRKPVSVFGKTVSHDSEPNKINSSRIKKRKRKKNHKPIV
ncbi:hypothetical protein ScPMuIL_009781 [Solemya velum]